MNQGQTKRARKPAKETDEQRLDRIKKLLEFKMAVHTNPVEVGWGDLGWLIDIARKSINGVD